MQLAERNEYLLFFLIGNAKLERDGSPMKEFRKQKVKLIKAQKEKSIKRTLLIGMVGLTMTVSILCGVFTGVVLYNNSNNDMIARVNESATAYNRSVQNAIANYKTKAETIAQNLEITNT